MEASSPGCLDGRGGRGFCRPTGRHDSMPPEHVCETARSAASRLNCREFLSTDGKLLRGSKVGWPFQVRSGEAALGSKFPDLALRISGRDSGLHGPVSIAPSTPGGWLPAPEEILLRWRSARAVSSGRVPGPNDRQPRAELPYKRASCGKRGPWLWSGWRVALHPISRDFCRPSGPPSRLLVKQPEDPWACAPWALKESVDGWPMASIIPSNLGVTRSL